MADDTQDPASTPSTPEQTPSSAEGQVTDTGPVDEDLVNQVRALKLTLDGMPDGPRPKPEGMRYKRSSMLVNWNEGNLRVGYFSIWMCTLTLLIVGFGALNFTVRGIFQRAAQIQLQRPFDDDTNTFLLVVFNAICLLLLIIGMAVYAIVSSHRVAGPAMRFRRALHALHRRDYDWYLRLRSKDYLQDLAEQLNGLNNALKAKDAVIADAVLELESLAKERPEIAEAVADVSASLCDVVLPLPLQDGEQAGRV